MRDNRILDDAGRGIGATAGDGTRTASEVPADPDAEPNRERRAALRAVADLPHDEGPFWMFDLSGDPETVKDAIRRYGARFIRRTHDPGVARRTFNHLAGYMGGHPGKAGSCIPPNDGSHGGAYLAFRADAAASTYYHEMLHLVANAHGYTSDAEATASALDEYDRDRDQFVAVNPASEAADRLRLRRHREWETGRAVPAEVERLMRAANDAWQRIVRTGRRDPDALDDVLPKPTSAISRYYAVNAEETLAAFQELFQSETPRQPPNWFFAHPDLTRAYTAVFDPAPRMRQVANSLHREYPRSSPWEELPYPNDGMDDSVLGTRERTRER